MRMLTSTALVAAPSPLAGEPSISPACSRPAGSPTDASSACRGPTASEPVLWHQAVQAKRGGQRPRRLQPAQAHKGRRLDSLPSELAVLWEAVQVPVPAGPDLEPAIGRLCQLRGRLPPGRNAFPRRRDGPPARCLAQPSPRSDPPGHVPPAARRSHGPAASLPALWPIPWPAVPTSRELPRPLWHVLCRSELTVPFVYYPAQSHLGQPGQPGSPYPNAGGPGPAPTNQLSFNSPGRNVGGGGGPGPEGQVYMPPWAAGGPAMGHPQGMPRESLAPL